MGKPLGNLAHACGKNLYPILLLKDKHVRQHGINPAQGGGAML
jgi:hypothetical protein